MNNNYHIPNLVQAFSCVYRKNYHNYWRDENITPPYFSKRSLPTNCNPYFRILDYTSRNDSSVPIKTIKIKY